MIINTDKTLNNLEELHVSSFQTTSKQVAYLTLKILFFCSTILLIFHKDFNSLFFTTVQKEIQKMNCILWRGIKV